VPTESSCPEGIVLASENEPFRATHFCRAVILQLESAAPVVGASPSDGLQIALDRCSQPWSSDGATCGGTITAVSPDRPATARLDLPASPALANGVTDHLRLTLRLPESVPSAAQGTTGSITLTAVGVQRPGRRV